MFSQKQHQRFYEFGGFVYPFWSRGNPKYPKWREEATARAHTHWEEEAGTGFQQTKLLCRKEPLKTQWFMLEKLFYFFSLSSAPHLFVWLCCVAPGTSRVTIRQLFLQEQASMKRCRKSDTARKYDKYSVLLCGILPFPSVYSWEEIYPSRYLFQVGSCQLCFSSFWESKAQISPLPAL